MYTDRDSLATYTDMSIPRKCGFTQDLDPVDLDIKFTGTVGNSDEVVPVCVL